MHVHVIAWHWVSEQARFAISIDNTSGGNAHLDALSKERAVLHGVHDDGEIGLDDGVVQTGAELPSGRLVGHVDLSARSLLLLVNEDLVVSEGTRNPPVVDVETVGALGSLLNCAALAIASADKENNTTLAAQFLHYS